MASNKLDFLPRKLTKVEIASASSEWTRILSSYWLYRLKALWLEENKPGYFTLLTSSLAAVAKKDRHLIDIASELTKGNMPLWIYLSLMSMTFSSIGNKEEGLKMAREAVKLNQSPQNLLSLAVETEDLNEMEDLAKKVINENPEDIITLTEAQRHLAYAKYFKGEREEGERLYKEILMKDPNNNNALESLGNINFFDKRDYEKALEFYLRIKFRTMPFLLLFKISCCYFWLGKINKAKKIVKKLPGSFVSEWGMSVEELKKEIDEGEKELNQAHKHCIYNRKELLASNICGCFDCIKTFKSDEIKEWIDKNNDTALCPYCGNDSVIGSASGFDIDNEFLTQMRNYWFSPLYGNSTLMKFILRRLSKLIKK